VTQFLSDRWCGLLLLPPPRQHLHIDQRLQEQKRWLDTQERGPAAGDWLGRRCGGEAPPRWGPGDPRLASPRVISTTNQSGPIRSANCSRHIATNSVWKLWGIVYTAYAATAPRPLASGLGSSGRAQHRAPAPRHLGFLTPGSSAPSTHLHTAHFLSVILLELVATLRVLEQVPNSLTVCTEGCI
jgi:hypothetical protein